MTLARLIDHTADALPPDALYTRIAFPDPPADRPYLFINMVATVDGKIVIGAPGGSAKGVGGPTDQLLFRRVQKVADASLIGSSTLRASPVLYPPEKPRFVVTRSGDVPLDNRFFSDAPDRAYVIAPEDLSKERRAPIEARAKLITAGRGDVDLKAALRILRQDYGIRHLLCEGGAILNDDLIRADLADELFLSLTPKLKGGEGTTPVSGQGFPPGRYLPLSLLSLYHDDDEFYFRYQLGSLPPVTASTPSR